MVSLCSSVAGAPFASSIAKPEAIEEQEAIAEPGAVAEPEALSQPEAGVETGVQDQGPESSEGGTIVLCGCDSQLLGSPWQGPHDEISGVGHAEQLVGTTSADVPRILFQLDWEVPGRDRWRE